MALHHTCLGMSDAAFKQEMEHDFNRIFVRTALEVGARHPSSIRLKTPPRDKTHAVRMDTEIASLEDISTKFYQLGEDFIVGDVLEGELR